MSDYFIDLPKQVVTGASLSGGFIAGVEAGETFHGAVAIAFLTAMGSTEALKKARSYRDHRFQPERAKKLIKALGGMNRITAVTIVRNRRSCDLRISTALDVIHHWFKVPVLPESLNVLAAFLAEMNLGKEAAIRSQLQQLRPGRQLEFTP